MHSYNCDVTYEARMTIITLKCLPTVVFNSILFNFTVCFFSGLTMATLVIFQNTDTSSICFDRSIGHTHLKLPF